MAIFQPTNIIPSSFTQGTVDAVKDNMEISWQVNGNSAMTAFQIDFYLNDTASTYVWSTGKITSYSFTNVSGQTLSLPFYGTDRFGRPQFFTYNAGKSWAQASMFEANPFTNGNNYKFKITQWYEGKNEVAKCQTSVALTTGNIYYFTALDGAVIYFSVSSNLAAGTNDIYYSYTNGTIWVDNRSKIVICGGGYNVGGAIPNNAIEVSGTISTDTLNALFVVQTSDSTFIARDTPTLTIFRSSTDQYADKIALPNGDEIATSIGYFVADYAQGQDDPIRWIRWQVATANNEVVGDILVDTGDIYTPTLKFEFNGFFNSQQYAIRCLGESESGQLCDTGWIYFNINYTENTYDGNFTAQCLNKENATLLEWEGVKVINGTYTSPEGSEEQYGLNSGSVTLPANSSITWDKVGAGSAERDMDFSAPWAAVWKGKTGQQPPEVTGFNSIQQISITHGTGYLLKYSPDGKLLLYYDFNARQILLYNVGESQLTLRGYLLSNGTITTIPTQYYAVLVNDMAFSHNNLFAVSTGNRLFLYEYDNETFNLIDSTDLSTRGSSIAFSPDGNILVRGGSDDYDTIVYSVSNNTLESLYSLQRAGKNIRGYIVAMDFNKDGTLLCLSIGSELADDITSIFEVNGNQITYSGDVINEKLFNLAFNKGANPDVLVIATGTTYYQYQVVNNNLSLVAAITNSPIMNQGISRAIAYSPDGKNLLIGGRSNVSWYGIENGALSYKGAVALPNGASWNNAIAITWNTSNNQVAIHNDGGNGSGFGYFNQIYNTVFSNPVYNPQGTLLTLNGADITLSRQDSPLILKFGNTQLASVTVPDNSTSVAMIITPTTANAYFYGDNGLISQSSTPITYTQQSITSVQIFGGDSGTTVESVSVYQGDGSNVLSLYKNPDFEPAWNDPNYELYMTANFNGNIQGGTGNAEGSDFQVYRREVGGSVLTPIANVSALTTSLKDYGIRSRKAYEYLLGVYDSNNAFMGLVTAQNAIATNFNNYSLLVCDYDQDKDEYHVRKQYLFALNLSTGGVGNNNSPTLNANFTQYPTRMPSTQNYASGTLQGLIGAIYTVPALIEQIGQYKYTAKPSTLDYFDSVDLEKELYDLSTAPYQLFLRDMKGRLRMVHTNGAISMTTNIKQKQQSISISFPWVEIGDASDVTVIQTPDDYGWNNDNQVLDVQLDVDTATGELSATYPLPYNGTQFYLTGVNKENLTANTPLGVTPARFNLSAVAEEPNDGEVTATVKVNGGGD